MIPNAVTIQTSDNGVDFSTIADQIIQLPKTAGALQVVMDIAGTKSRFLKVIARPYGKTPAGNNAFLFVDEVIVE